MIAGLAPALISDLACPPRSLSFAAARASAPADVHRLSCQRSARKKTSMRVAMHTPGAHPARWGIAAALPWCPLQPFPATPFAEGG
jgi:hypothetical protein